MTVGDDLALLAIHPRRRRVRRTERLPYALRAAELAELALEGRIALGQRRIEVREGSGQPDDRRLRNTLRTLTDSEPAPTLKEWLRRTPRGLGNEYLSRLEDRRTIRVARERGRDGRTRTRVLRLDRERYAEVRGRLDAAVAGRSGEERARALAALVHTAGLGRYLYGPLLGLRSRLRLAALARSDAGFTEGDVLTAALQENAARAMRELLAELPNTYGDMTAGLISAGDGTPAGGFDAGSHHSL